MTALTECPAEITYLRNIARERRNGLAGISTAAKRDMARRARRFLDSDGMAVLNAHLDEGEDPRSLAFSLAAASLLEPYTFAGVIFGDDDDQ